MKNYPYLAGRWVIALVVVLAAASLRAQTFDWVAADGDWDDAGAWNGATFVNKAPVNFTADILSPVNNSGSLANASVTLTVGQIITGPGILARRVISDDGGTYTLEWVNGTGGATAGNVSLVANTDVSVRFGSAGTTNVSGVKYLNQILTNSFTGTRTISGAAGAVINFATKDGGDAVSLSGAGSLVFDGVNLTNGDLTVNNNLNLNNNGSGLLVFKNATLNSRDGAKFYNAANSETVFENINFEATQTGRYLQFQRGIFTFKGSNATSGAFTPGRTSFGGNGAVTVNFDANSNFTVSGGDLIFALGNELVTANVSGTLTSNSRLQFGNSSGTAVMNVNNGGVARQVGGDFNVANSSGRGTLNINTGGTAFFNNMYVGANSGTGIVNVSGGMLSGTTANANLYIGHGTGLGQVNVTGGTARFAGDIYVVSNQGGSIGHGELNVSGGLVETVGGKWLYINRSINNNGTSGIVTVSGGTLSVNHIAFGNGTARTATVSNTARLDLTGGTLIVRGGGIHTGNYDSYGQYDPLKTATDTQVNLGGGTLVIQASATSSVPMTLTGINGNVKLDMRGANGTDYRVWTVRGGLTGAGGLDVTYGTLLLQGANNYHGQTRVSTGGTFMLDTGATLTLTLADLGGLAAFDGPGTLTLNGTVTISDIDTFASASYRLFGDDLLGRNLTLNDNWLAGFTKSGDQWLYDNDNSIFFDKTTGILTLAQIPEPSALALLVTGGALLLVFRRRR